MKRVLIFGLPGAGKSTLAEKLVEVLGNADWHNADKIRETFNDWDFSPEGRERQSLRMRDYVRKSVAKGNYGVADFVCPTNELREKNVPEYVIWMDTIEEGRYEDTNKMFEQPDGSTFINARITADQSGGLKKKLMNGQGYLLLILKIMNFNQSNQLHKC